MIFDLINFLCYLVGLIDLGDNLRKVELGALAQQCGLIRYMLNKGSLKFEVGIHSRGYITPRIISYCNNLDYNFISSVMFHVETGGMILNSA